VLIRFPTQKGAIDVDALLPLHFNFFYNTLLGGPGKPGGTAIKWATSAVD
jgi:hypothetical protein